MCKNVFKPPSDPAVTADNIRQQQLNEQSQNEAHQSLLDSQAREQRREQGISQGEDQINGIFSQFNEPYYQKFTQAYLDSQNPQVDRQFNDAQTTSSNQLGERGLLESSVANKVFGDLTRSYGDARTTIANNAQTQTNNLRSNVASARTDLENLNQQTADPPAVAAASVGRATALSQAQPQTDQVGDVFASILNPLAAYAYERSRAIAPLNYGFSGRAPNSGASYSIVS